MSTAGQLTVRERAAQFVRALAVTALPRRRPLEIVKLGFDIVHGCQLRCLGCPNASLRPAIRHIALEDFRRCLQNLDVAAVRAFRLYNFGEPLLHPRLPQLVAQIRSFPFKVKKIEISTNGQHHDFAALEEVFKTGMLDLLVVSCDGDGTAEEYERLRPPGKWSKLLEFLEKARDLRDRHAPRVKLITRTVCEHPEGRERWSRVLEPRGWTSQFRGWVPLPGANRSPSAAGGKPGRGLCVYAQDDSHCYVDCDGTVVPCCAHPQAYVLGNLREQKYSRILRGMPRKKLVSLLALRRGALPVCSQCGL